MGILYVSSRVVSSNTSVTRNLRSYILYAIDISAYKRSENELEEREVTYVFVAIQCLIYLFQFIFSVFLPCI
jgi:hypothetical protein